MCFDLVGLSSLSVLTLCLKDPPMGDDTIYLELFLIVEMVRWGQIACVLAAQRQEKLYVNNKHLFIETQQCNNNIYNTYIYMYMELCHFLLYFRDKQLKYLAGVVYVTQFFG